MAIKIKPLFADALLDLVERKKLSSITINDLITDTGASRQTFYNHFRDKDDLIQWIYINYILDDFQAVSADIPYREHLLDYYQKLQKYKKFMRQAIIPHGQTDLRSYMAKYLSDWERGWFEMLYIKKHGANPPGNFYFFSAYHSAGCINMIFNWLEQNCPTPPEEICRNIISLRAMVLEQWDMLNVASDFNVKL